MELKLEADEVALVKHVSRFMDNGFFSPSTVGAGLKTIHGHNSSAKGYAIAGFNATHSGNWSCPFGKTEFKADADNEFKKYLHLGTTRIWNHDGTVNEERWEQFKAAVTSYNEEKVAIVTKSSLDAYLAERFAHDPQEVETGRNAKSWLSSANMQSFAANEAWKEVYDRLTDGWILKDKKYEPYMTLELVRLFFEDSKAAFARAESGELPVTKPKESDELAEEDISALTI